MRLNLKFHQPKDVFYCVTFRSRRLITDLRMDVKADKVLAALGTRGNRHLFLRPWTFSISSLMSWIDHGPVFNVRAQSEVLRLGVGPNHILALNAISTHLQENCPEFFGTSQSSSKQESSVVGNVVKLLSPPTTSNESDVKNDQHYIDDLRAGAFQYVEADSADHTKPYQVDQPAVFIIKNCSRIIFATFN